MTPTDRAAEQAGFGGAGPGAAQAEEPPLEPAMIDEGGSDDASPEEVVRNLFAAVFNAGELDQIERFVAPDHRNHDPTAPDVPPGPQGVRILAENYREAFPDIEFELEQIFASGDRVAHRWTFRGTHEGEFAGIGPTGRRVEVLGMEIDRLARGKIAESWTISDAAGLERQLRAGD